jgi:hypothetical protein
MNERMQSGYEFAKGEIQSGRADFLQPSIDESRQFGHYNDFDRGIEKALRERYVTGEWIEWVGGEMPVTGSTRVDIRFSSGTSTTCPIPADTVRWGHVAGAPSNVVKYRVNPIAREQQQ